MPMAQLMVTAGMTPEQKRLLVSKVTDALVEVEEIPSLRSTITVIVVEVDEGGWGIGGNVVTRSDLENVKAADASRRQSQETGAQEASGGAVS